MTPNNSYGSIILNSTVNVAFAATSVTTAAISAPSNVIRIVSTSDCFIEISPSGTPASATSSLYLPAISPEYFQCPTNCKVSVIQEGVPGTLYVTPCQ